MAGVRRYSLIYDDVKKHIGVKYHFIQPNILNEISQVEKVPTDENPLDIGTKVVLVKKLLFSYIEQCLIHMALRTNDETMLRETEFRGTEIQK